MKARYLLPLFLLFGLSVFGQRKIDLGKAIEQGLVTASIYGAYNPMIGELEEGAESSYSGKCMIAELESKTDEALILTLQAGRLLMCADTNTQDMVVTRAMKVELAPFATARTVLSAMCSEMHDHAPNSLKTYSVGDMAPKPLTAIAKAIQRRGAKGMPAQCAVWAHTDRATRRELLNHWATEAALRQSVAILNEAGVYTALNPKPVESQAVEAAPAVAAAPPAQAASPTPVQQAPFDWWPIACGALFLSAGTALVFVLRRKKDEDWV